MNIAQSIYSTEKLYMVKLKITATRKPILKIVILKKIKPSFENFKAELNFRSMGVMSIKIIYPGRTILVKGIIYVFRSLGFH